MTYEPDIVPGELAVEVTEKVLGEYELHLWKCATFTGEPCDCDGLAILEMICELLKPYWPKSEKRP